MKKLFLLLLVISLLVPSAAFAEGFALYEWSAAGNAMSQNYMFGENDPSVLAYNPAQITKLRGSYLNTGFAFVNPSISLDYYRNGKLIEKGSTCYNPATVPSLFWAQDCNGANFWWGLGVFARFGNALELPANGPGHNDNIFAGVTSITFQPTVAFKPHKKWSVALGLDVNYGALKNKRNVAFDPTQSSYVPHQDLFTQLTGENVSLGYVLSAMYDFNEKTSVALLYRSRIHHSINNADFYGDIPVFPLAGFNGGSMSTKAETAVTLPDSITLGIGHKFNDRTRIEANVTWTNWSLYDKMDVTFANPYLTKPSTLIENYWKNAWKIGVGIEHKLSKKWTLLAGYTWDQSPFPNEWVNLSLPTGNRHYISAGFKYALNDTMTLACSYCYTILGDRVVHPRKDLLEHEDLEYDWVQAHSEHSHNVGLSLTIKMK